MSDKTPRMTQTNFALALYACLLSVESKCSLFFFMYFYRDMVNNISVAAGKNVRGTQGSPKKWSESLNKCEISGKKAKYATFCGSDQAAGKCLERGRYMTVLNFIPFSRIPRLNSSKNIKCFFRNLKRFQSIALGFCRISRKIIIETSLKHLMFVRKCQAILKQVWSCSGQIPRA